MNRIGFFNTYLQPSLKKEHMFSDTIDLDNGYLEVIADNFQSAYLEAQHHTLYKQLLGLQRLKNVLDLYFCQSPFIVEHFVTLSIDNQSREETQEIVDDFVLPFSRKHDIQKLQSDIQDEIKQIDDYETQATAQAILLIQKKCQGTPQAADFCIHLSTNSLSVTLCVQHAKCCFYLNTHQYIESYYDINTNSLILKAPKEVNVYLTQIPALHSLYLMGNFSIQTQEVNIELDLINLGKITLEEVQIKTQLFFSMGSDAVITKTSIDADLLCIKQPTHIQEVYIIAEYCRLHAYIWAVDLSIKASFCNILEGHYNNATFVSDCFLSQSQNQCLAYENALFKVEHLTALNKHKFTDCRLENNCEDGAYILKGDVVFQKCNIQSKKTLLLSSEASILLENECNFCTTYLVNLGQMAIQNSRIECERLLQDNGLTIENCQLAVQDSLLITEKALTVLIDRVHVVAGKIDIHGHFKDKHSDISVCHRFEVREQLSVHKNAHLEIVFQILHIMAKEINLLGECRIKHFYATGNIIYIAGIVAAEQAQFTCHKYCYNHGRLMMDEFILMGNFYNILGDVYIKKQMSVQDGLLEVNFGLIVANNYSHSNRLTRNLGAILPNFSAEYDDLFTFKNACSIAHSIAPACINQGNYVVSLAERLPNLIQQMARLMKNDSSTNQHSFNLSIFLTDLWTNQICNTKKVEALKCRIQSEINTLYTECKNLIYETGEYEVSWSNYMKNMPWDDWVCIDFDTIQEVKNDDMRAKMS